MLFKTLPRKNVCCPASRDFLPKTCDTTFGKKITHCGQHTRLDLATGRFPTPLSPRSSQESMGRKLKLASAIARLFCKFVFLTEILPKCFTDPSYRIIHAYPALPIVSNQPKRELLEVVFHGDT